MMTIQLAALGALIDFFADVGVKRCGGRGTQGHVQLRVLLLAAHCR